MRLAVALQNFIFQEPRESLIAGSSSLPGCLSSLVTLTIPVEQRVLQFREDFSHAIADVRSRVQHLLGRTEEVGEQTSALRQQVDEHVEEMKRQTSNLSERLDCSSTESDRRQTELEQQAVSLEVRTTLQEEAMSGNMKKLTHQLGELKERVSLAESDATKAKIKCDDMTQNSINRVDLSETDQQALLQRLVSLEHKFANFSNTNSKPRRSISHP